MQVVYWLDTDNVIVDTNPDWDIFAEQNDGALCLSDQVKGLLLYHFIAGDATRMWVDVMLSHARIRGAALTRNYRCDSPSERRYMEMTIVPEANGLVRLEHTLLRCEPIEPSIVYEFPLAAARRSSHLKRCSMCNQIQIGETWCEGDAAAHAGLIDASMPVRVIYTVCSPCKQMLPNSVAQARAVVSDATV